VGGCGGRWKGDGGRLESWEMGKTAGGGGAWQAHPINKASGGLHLFGNDVTAFASAS
jgi:hypothetical protein